MVCSEQRKYMVSYAEKKILIVPQGGPFPFDPRSTNASEEGSVSNQMHTKTYTHIKKGMSDQPVYILGHHQRSKHVSLLVLSPTEKGWRCRSTLRNDMNHDYVKKESAESVIEDWIEKEMTRTYVSSDRDEVLALLAKTEDPNIPSTPGEVYIQSFLHGNLELPEYERAERVLQHLECGW